MSKIKNHNHKRNHKTTNHHKNMEHVKIKRVKRNKKKVSTKEKVLAGLGVGSMLLGGIGAVSPQQKPTQFVRTEEQQKEEGTKTSKVKEALKRIFGIQKAKAMEEMEEETPLEEVPSIEPPIEPSVEPPVEPPVLPPTIDTSNLTVTPDINDALTGTMTVNGQQQQLSVLPDGRIFNDQGQEVTDTFSSSDADAIRGAFADAPVSPPSPPAPEPASPPTIDTSKLTVTPDINDALTGTVNVGGQEQRLSVLPDGRIFNDQGQEVTDTFSSSDADAIRSAFVDAPVSPPPPAGEETPPALPDIIVTAANTPYENMTKDEKQAFTDYFKNGQNADQIPSSFTGTSAFAMGLGLGLAGSPGSTAVGANGHNYTVSKDGNWVDLGLPPTGTLTGTPMAPEILAGAHSNLGVPFTPTTETGASQVGVDLNNLPDSFDLNSDIARSLGLRSDLPSTVEGDVPVTFLILGDSLYEWDGNQFVKSASGSEAAALISQGKYTDADWYKLYPNSPGVGNLFVGITKDTARNIAALPLAMGAYAASMGGSFGATYTATLAAALSPATLGIGAAISGAIFGIKAIVNRGQDKVRDTQRIESAYPYFNDIMQQYWSVTPQSPEEAKALHDAAQQAIQGIFDQIQFEKDSSKQDQQRWLQLIFYNGLDENLNQWQQSFQQDFARLEVYQQPNGIRIASVGQWGQIRVSPEGKLLSWENITQSVPPPDVIAAIANRQEVVQLGAGLPGPSVSAPYTKNLEVFRTDKGLAAYIGGGGIDQVVYVKDGNAYDQDGNKLTNVSQEVINAIVNQAPAGGGGAGGGGIKLPDIIVTAANTPYANMTQDEKQAFTDYFSSGQNADQIPSAFTGTSAFAMGLGLGPAGSKGSTAVGANGHNYIVSKDGNWVDLGLPFTGGGTPIAPEILAGISSNLGVLSIPITPTPTPTPTPPVSGWAGLVTTPSPSSLAQAYPRAAQLFIQNGASQYMNTYTLDFWQRMINQYGQADANRLFQTILGNPDTYNVTSSNWDSVVQSAAQNLGIVGYVPGTSAAAAVGLSPSFFTNPTVTLPYDTTRPLNPAEYATLETAMAMANLFGGTVVTSSFYFGNTPQYGIEVDGRYIGNAGALANSMMNNSPLVFVEMLNKWGGAGNLGSGNPLWEAAKAQLQSPLLANSATPEQAAAILPASLLPYYVPDNVRFAQPSRSLVVAVAPLAPGASTTTSYTGSFGSLANIKVQRTDSNGLTVTFTDPSTKKEVTLTATSDEELYSKMQPYYQSGNNQSLTVFYALDQVRGNWDNYTATPQPGPQPNVVVTSGGPSVVNALETNYTINGQTVTARLVSLLEGGISVTLLDKDGKPLVNPQTGQPMQNVIVSDRSALADLEFTFRQREGGTNSLISGALMGVLGTWNSSRTGVSFAVPSGTPQVWGDQYGNRATYVGELGGTVYYDASSRRLILDRGGGELLVLTDSIAFNQGSVQALQKTLLNTPLYGGGGSDLPSSVPAERQYSSDYNMMTQLGIQGIQQINIQPKTGRPFSGSQEFREAYQNAQYPFTFTVGNNSAGVRVYTFTITVNGQPVTRTFVGTDDINQFLSPYYSEDSFLDMSPEDQAVFTSAINARLRCPEIGLGIPGLPVPYTNHNQTIRYQQADGNWVTSTNYFSPNQLSFREEAEYFQKMFPGSQIVERALSETVFPGMQTNIDPNDPRRVYELVLPDGTRMDVGWMRNSMYTSGGITGLPYLPSQAANYFEPPAGSNVRLVAFNPSVPAGTGISATQTPTNLANVKINHITVYNSNGNNANGVISPGSTIEIGGSGLSTFRNFAVRVRPYGSSQSRDLAISQATITDNKITLTVPRQVSNDFPAQGSALLLLDGQEYVFSSFTFTRNVSTAATAQGAGQSATGRVGATAASGEERAYGDNLNANVAGTRRTATAATSAIGTATEGVDEEEVEAGEGETESAAVSNVALSAADQQTVRNLQQTIGALNSRIDTLNSQLSSRTSSGELARANGEISTLRAEVSRLTNLVSNLRSGVSLGGSSGQVQTLGAVDQMAQGLQMPLGYPASTGGPGLQMPPGYPASGGARLQMPPGYPASEGYVASAAVSGVKAVYKVKKGDTLWNIAKKYYGDGRKWRKILEANPTCLSKPSNTRTLIVGAELTIPEL